jgi:hypothetical protein
MRKIICTIDDQVIDLAVSTEDTSNGLLVQAVNGSEYYVGFEVKVIEIDEANVPLDFVPYLYCYSGENFFRNQNYVPPAKSIQELELELESMKQAILDLTELVLGV